MDSHHHFWDLEKNSYPWLNGNLNLNFRYGDYTSLKRSYLPEDYFRDSLNFSVVGSVHVEAEWDRRDPLGETKWIHKIAEKWGLPTGLIAFAKLDQDDAAFVLREHAQYPLTRGIRQKPSETPSPEEFQPGIPGSMADPRWRAGYALLNKYGLHFELQTRYWHLGEAGDLVRDFPETMVVINHAGVPEDRTNGAMQLWRSGMSRLAEYNNVRVKISGIGLRHQPWSIESNTSIILELINMFGVERCMFGSNFPVDSLVSDFDTIFKGYREVVGGFSVIDQRRLFCQNAKDVYRL